MRTFFFGHPLGVFICSDLFIVIVCLQVSIIF
uniref:E3 SUMO-protein ligase SIZ1 isoform X2 n=1 Tax=Rhizophora mucronata TaxID=61149 RepID=A0A2P2MH83_RHIMU